MNKKENYTLFISDLHLGTRNNEKNRIFFDFLQNDAVEADALYILGDLFVLWVGDDDNSKEFEKVKKALKNASSSGTKIFLMPGNRDFLLGEKFAKESGCALLNDPAITDIYGRKTLLMHGDSLCSNDILHKYISAVIRAKLSKKIFLTLPLIVRKFMAWSLHLLSTARLKLVTKQAFLKHVYQQAIIAMENNDVDQIIHGHIHDANIDDIIIGSKHLRRIVLKDWDTSGMAVIYKQNGSCEVKNLQ